MSIDGLDTALCVLLISTKGKELQLRGSSMGVGDFRERGYKDNLMGQIEELTPVVFGIVL